MSRISLTTSVNYYVATTGNDTTGDGSAGNPWATPMKAIKWVTDNVDYCRMSVTINIGAGTWNGQRIIIKPQTGGGLLYLLGAGAGQTFLSWNGSDGNATIETWGAQTFLGGFTVSNTGAWDCIHVTRSSFCQLGVIEYGVAGANHIDVDSCSMAMILDDYIISGGAKTHIAATINGTCSIYSGTATLTNTPNFANSFIQASECGSVQALGNYSGSATGKRYDAHNNGVIYTAARGATFLPGNAPGITYNGGVYD